MNKAIIFIGAIIPLYFGSVLYRTHVYEGAAEKYVEVTLLNIANPWSAEKFEEQATWVFLEKAKLKPSEVARLANESLGSLEEILIKPKCNLQRGTDAYSNTKHTYAICAITGKFEKSTNTLKIRLQDDGDWKNGSWKINAFISVN